MPCFKGRTPSWSISVAGTLATQRISRPRTKTIDPGVAVTCNDTHVTRAKIRRDPQPASKAAQKSLGAPKQTGANQDRKLLPARAATIEQKRLERQDAIRDRWTMEYEDTTPGDVCVVEIALGDDIYVFDSEKGRLVGWTGLSERQEQERDSSRLRGMPKGGREGDTRQYHRSHVKSHGEGGGLDINIFPGLASLNLGKAWTSLEKYAREHLGTPHSVRLIYDDDSQVPARLEAEITLQDGTVVTREFDHH